ncbi:hypothetical protein K439DRAFT_1626426 [Ramaria rubella]|nr:hypothetical protein K439DRAFT_1626426 [Ramaria rubella]
MPPKLPVVSRRSVRNKRAPVKMPETLEERRKRLCPDSPPSRSSPSRDTVFAVITNAELTTNKSQSAESAADHHSSTDSDSDSNSKSNPDSNPDADSDEALSTGKRSCHDVEEPPSYAEPCPNDSELRAALRTLDPSTLNDMRLARVAHTLSKAYLRPRFATGPDYKSIDPLIPYSARKSWDFRTALNLFLHSVDLDSFVIPGNARAEGFKRWEDHVKDGSKPQRPVFDQDARDALWLQISMEANHTTLDGHTPRSLLILEMIIQSWLNPRQTFDVAKVDSLLSELAAYRSRAVTYDDYVHRLHRELLFKSAFIFPQPELVIC